MSTGKYTRKRQELNIIGVQKYTILDIIEEIDALNDDYYSLIDKQQNALQKCKQVIISQNNLLKETQGDAGGIVGKLNKTKF